MLAVVLVTMVSLSAGGVGLADSPSCLFWDTTSGSSADEAVAAYRQQRLKKLPTDFHASTGTLGGKDVRLTEHVRQMNLDGKLGKEVPIGERFSSDADRASYEKVPRLAATERRF